MSAAGSFKTVAYAAKDKAQSVDSKLRSEVFGGDWNDDVGYSYLSYTENMRRVADSFVSASDNLDRIEKSLDSMDEKADRAKLEKLKSAVNSI